MEKFWVLDGKIAKPTTIAEWSTSFQKGPHRVGIEQWIYQGKKIIASCVFIGYSDYPFEMMVFHDGAGVAEQRTATWEEAESLFKETVEFINQNIAQQLPLKLPALSYVNDA